MSCWRQHDVGVRFFHPRIWRPILSCVRIVRATFRFGTYFFLSRSAHGGFVYSTATRALPLYCDVVEPSNMPWDDPRLRNTCAQSYLNSITSFFWKITNPQIQVIDYSKFYPLKSFQTITYKLINLSPFSPPSDPYLTHSFLIEKPSDLSHVRMCLWSTIHLLPPTTFGPLTLATVHLLPPAHRICPYSDVSMLR